MVDGRVRGNRFGEPDVAADHRVVADYRVAAEDRAPGINDDIVLDGRMALLSAQLFVHVGRSEGNALIEAYVLADYRCRGRCRNGGRSARRG